MKKSSNQPKKSDEDASKKQATPVNEDLQLNTPPSLASKDQCTYSNCPYAPCRFAATLYPIIRITIKIGDFIYFKNIDNIIYLVGHPSKTSMFMHTSHVDCREGQSDESLHYFQEHLPPDRFFRCHKSYIVNMDYVEYFIPNKRGGQFKMIDGTMIPVSQRKRDGIDGLRIYYGHYFEGK